MSQAPQLHHADTLRHYNNQAGLPDGRWVMARPLSCTGVIGRIRLAWGVFTGRYDALKWEQQ